MLFVAEEGLNNTHIKSEIAVDNDNAVFFHYSAGELVLAVKSNLVYFDSRSSVGCYIEIFQPSRMCFFKSVCSKNIHSVLYTPTNIRLTLYYQSKLQYRIGLTKLATQTKRYSKLKIQS